ncbi:hypothetical protein ACP70R_037220 [Stipagrostis hirtigluma subsp. patula]
MAKINMEDSARVLVFMLLIGSVVLVAQCCRMHGVEPVESVQRENASESTDYVYRRCYASRCYDPADQTCFRCIANGHNGTCWHTLVQCEKNCPPPYQ